jgi:N,N'-diacetyllegionaminate synthase
MKSIFVIAEIGVNWDGDFEIAKQMMLTAKKAGCNAVKFQSFNESIVMNHPEKSRLLSTSISEKNIETINDMAKDVGIEWFSTPMFPEAVIFLDPFVKRFKIREKDSHILFENKTSPILDKILKLNKEVIISSEKSPKSLPNFCNSNIHWLYCIPKYPCQLTDFNFNLLPEFDGFSNHCPQIIAPLTSAILGAKIIEVHTSSDKSGHYFDNDVSFDESELIQLLKFIRQSEKIKKL